MVVRPAHGALLCCAAFALVALSASAGAGVSVAGLWGHRYNGSASGNDVPRSIAASPDGTRVFVTGTSLDQGTGTNFATFAYDAATGKKVWRRRFDGGGRNDFANALAVSADGMRVLVAGASRRAGNGMDFAVVAYDALTGSQLWRKFHDAGHGDDGANAVAVSPDGTRVYVAGGVSTGGGDYYTTALDAVSGKTLWAASYDGPNHGGDGASSIAVGSDGTVFVTGTSEDDYATIAYDGLSGAPLWTSRFDDPEHEGDSAAGIAVSENGTRVFVTGTSSSEETIFDYTTVAYDAASGAQLWVRNYDGVGAEDFAAALGVSPDGARVFVTGSSIGSGTLVDYATVAYDAGTGTRLWARRYPGPRSGDLSDRADALAVSPDGTQLIVTGEIAAQPVEEDFVSDYGTVAYDPATGARLWTRHYNGPANNDDVARAVSVSPDGSRVFVTGQSWGGESNQYDYATVAYSAR